jgi:demethylmenaquinone methyltransferase/2-methoxy-6-polyprenyl-1,4-benzoquinol methylase
MTFETASQKHQYVNQMFSRIAHRYDLMNRVMTGGQDVHWRKLLVEQARLPVNGSLLDIATGTGDIAFEALEQHPDLEQVVGADFTLPMMDIGRKRPANEHTLPRMRWSGADTLHLPFPNDTFDAVVSGFLMRNVVSVSRALSEQVRVLKPGGRLLILEIPRPPDNLLGYAFRLYFHNIVPLVGGMISGQPDAYSYLPASADAFLRPDELATEMKQAGLRQVTYQMLMFRTVALHAGTK